MVVGVALYIRVPAHGCRTAWGPQTGAPQIREVPMGAFAKIDPPPSRPIVGNPHVTPPSGLLSRVDRSHVLEKSRAGGCAASPQVRKCKARDKGLGSILKKNRKPRHC